MCVNTGSYYDTWPEIVEFTSLSVNGNSSFILTTTIGLHVCIDSSRRCDSTTHVQFVVSASYGQYHNFTFPFFIYNRRTLDYFIKSGYTIYILNLDTGSRKYWNICDLFVKCWLRTYTVHRGQGEFW